MRQALATTEPDAVSAAADALHWPGIVVRGVQLLGDRVDVVVRLAAVEHARRLSKGEAAVFDAQALTQRLECEPAFRDRSPLETVGILVRRARWSSARRVARGYAAFGPAAVVVPVTAAVQSLNAIEADYVGVGLVAVEGEQARVLVPPPPWQAPTWTWVRRLGEEVIYARTLALGLAG